MTEKLENMVLKLQSTKNGKKIFEVAIDLSPGIELSALQYMYEWVGKAIKLQEKSNLLKIVTPEETPK